MIFTRQIFTKSADLAGDIGGGIADPAQRLRLNDEERRKRSGIFAFERRGTRRVERRRNKRSAKEMKRDERERLREQMEEERHGRLKRVLGYFLFSEN